MIKADASPPTFGDEDPEQSVRRAERRTFHRSRQHGQLLTEREILSTTDGAAAISPIDRKTTISAVSMRDLQSIGRKSTGDTVPYWRATADGWRDRPLPRSAVAPRLRATPGHCAMPSRRPTPYPVYRRPPARARTARDRGSSRTAISRWPIPFVAHHDAVQRRRVPGLGVDPHADHRGSRRRRPFHPSTSPRDGRLSG